MSNYNQKSVSGTQWTRCPLVQITNPLGGEAIITMQEETLVQLAGDGLARIGSNALKFPFTPDEVIELRDPTTGATTGNTLTQAHLYIALYSLYIQRALARDAVVAENEKAAQEA